MPDTPIVYETVVDRDARFAASLFEMENAVIAFFDEECSLKLGTLTVAIPQIAGDTCVSSVLLGDRNALLTKVLAEQLVRAFKKIAVVSSHLPVIQDHRTSTLLIHLAKKLCDKAKAKSQEPSRPPIPSDVVNETETPHGH